MQAIIEASLVCVDRYFSIIGHDIFLQIVYYILFTTQSFK